MSDSDELIELTIGALRTVVPALHAMISGALFSFDSPFQVRRCAHVSSIHRSGCCGPRPLRFLSPALIEFPVCGQQLAPVA